MRTEIERRPAAGSVGALVASDRRSAGAAVRRASLILIASMMVGSPVFAQPPAYEGVSQSTATSAPAAKGSHAPVGRLSKFEARRIRHACHGQANERGLAGAEREAVLSKCYLGRVAHRGVRRDCHQQGVAKGLDKAVLREYVRECVKDRTRPKE
ncbi:MAG: hypothetical protein HYS06_05075 [Methylocystis sp.]|nr:hypothetical protein [Methylocystis sp.]